jgi:hypothetical protein
MKLAVAVGAVMLLAPWKVSAQGTHSTTAAEALFTEGQALLKAGKYAEACPKLAESQKIEPAVGTQLNLAVCLKGNGQLASAWSTFLAAASSARDAGQTQRADYARKEAAALEPSLGRLAIVPPSSPAPEGLLVSVDGTDVPRGLWASGLPLDAGEHTVEVTAKGYRSVTQTVSTEDKAKRSFTLPALEPESSLASGNESVADPGQASGPQEPGVESRQSDAGSQRTIAVVIGGIGLVGLGVGGYFALNARGKFSDSDPECNENNICTPSGKELRDGAQTSATVATISTGVGIAALAGAAVLWFTSGSSGSSKSPSTVAVLPSANGVYVRGGF